MAPPPGRMPRKNPRKVPLPMGLPPSPVFHGGKRFLNFVLITSCSSSFSRFSRTSEMPKSPITRGTSPTPSTRPINAEGEAGLPVMTSWPIRLRKSPSRHDEAAGHRPLGQVDEQGQAEATREKYSAGPKMSASAASGVGKEHQPDEAEGPCDEGAESGDAEGRSRPALKRHLVAVEASDDGGRLTGNIDQDRRCRAAVHGAVVDACKHDDAGDGRDAEGDGEQQGHRAPARYRGGPPRASR